MFRGCHPVEHERDEGSRNLNLRSLRCGHPPALDPSGTESDPRHGCSMRLSMIGAGIARIAYKPFLSEHFFDATTLIAPDAIRPYLCRMYCTYMLRMRRAHYEPWHHCRRKLFVCKPGKCHHSRRHDRLSIGYRLP